MLEAVQELHKLNIVHADIKPQNFLLVDGCLKLIDFGIAIEIPPGQDYAVRRYTGGTIGYIAPEMLGRYIIEDGALNLEAMYSIKGVRVTTKTDIWALGMILYLETYKVLPFNSVPCRKWAQLKALDPNVPVDFAASIPVDPLLLDVMKKCLDKNPNNRPTVADLLQHPYLRPRNKQVRVVDKMEVCRVCKGSLRNY